MKNVPLLSALVLVALAAFIRCSPAARTRTGAVIGGVLGGAAGTGSAAPAQTDVSSMPSGVGAKLMLFGGEGHKVYLGCLNCDTYAVDSISNEYGPHGSRYAQESIFNRYGEYGSPYSDKSACNRYANDPPVIVDRTGAYYGRLTLNPYHPEIGIGCQLLSLLASICGIS